jgi:hypothetical protein
VAPPPKPKLTGASGPNVDSSKSEPNSQNGDLNKILFHEAEIFTGSYCDISDRYTS